MIEACTKSYSLQFIIIIWNVYFPCFNGLDGFLNDYLHSGRFCARSQLIFRDFKSLSTTGYQVFRDLPFLCCPSTTISLHFFTTLSSLHLSTWPNHLNLPLLMQFLILSRPKHSLSSEEGFLCFKVVLHIHLISYHCAPASISQPLSLPKFLLVNSTRSLNYFHPDIVLAITLSSAQPASTNHVA